MKINVLSITDARKQPIHEPLWVFNNTVFNPHLHKKEHNQARANVVFSLRTSSGELSTIPVFATWVPTCLSEVAPKDAILNSQSFMRAVNIGKLIIIDDASAQAILNQKGAREELERVRRMDINSATGDALGAIEGETDSVQIEVQASDMNKDPGTKPEVLTFLELMENGTGIEALNSLRSLGQLSKEDWLTVMRRAQSIGESHKDVVDYCKEMLTLLKNQA